VKKAEQRRQHQWQKKILGDKSQQLMKAMSLQSIDKNMGVPVSDICLEKTLHPNESR